MVLRAGETFHEKQEAQRERINRELLELLNELRVALPRVQVLFAAFDGEGARMHGGRWNNPGVAVVYTSQSQALAALELLANLEQALLLKSYAAIPMDFDDALVSTLDEAALPADWAAQPAPASARAIGDAWVAAAASVALRVPSAVIPSEFNYLLNPSHPDFRRVRIGKPVRFAFDPRITAKRPR